MSFAAKLQEIRTEHGISQEELAEMLNVSRQSVSKWERGRGYPEIDKLIHISERFGVSLDDLLKDKKDHSGNTRRTINLSKEADSSGNIRTAYPENSSGEEIYPAAGGYAERNGDDFFNHEVVSGSAFPAQYGNYSTGAGSSVRSSNSVRWSRSRYRINTRRLTVLIIILVALTAVLISLFAYSMNVSHYDPEPFYYEDTFYDEYTEEYTEYPLQCLVDEKTGTKFVVNGDTHNGIITDFSDPMSNNSTELKDIKSDVTVYCSEWYIRECAHISLVNDNSMYIIPYEMICQNVDIDRQQHCRVGCDQYNQLYWIPEYILNAFNETEVSDADTDSVNDNADTEEIEKPENAEESEPAE